MTINTAFMGAVEVEENQILHLPDGLYGFEEKGDYALITQQEDDATLMWLQPVDDAVPCFVVFNPLDIVQGFEPDMEQADLRFLECEDAGDLAFLVIAVIPEDLTKITVNLKSPIAVNLQTRRARQVILQNRDYPIKFPLFEQQEVR